jgi:glycosyltransferase 2 family protein
MSAWWSKNRRLILQLVGTVLAIGLIVVLLREEGWQDILAAFKQIKPINLFWAALLFLLARFSVVGRWYMLLRSGGIKMRVQDSAALTFTSLFASNFLPTTVGGDLVRLAGAMQMGFDRAVCLASIAADRLMGMLGMSMMAPLGLWYSWGVLQNSAAFSFVAFLQKPFDFIKRTFSVFGIWLKKPSGLFGSLAFAWLNMLCQFSAMYLFAKDLGSHAPFWMIASLWSLIYFITLIPISINGYGVQELSSTYLLSHVAGLTPAVSLSIAVLLRAYFILSSLPGALFLPSILSAMAEQKKDLSSVKILS